MPDKSTPRGQLHHGVRHIFSGQLAAYYKKHPEKLRDPNLEENIDGLQKLMLMILEEIDKFEIGFKEPTL